MDSFALSISSIIASKVAAPSENSVTSFPSETSEDVIRQSARENDGPPPRGGGGGETAVTGCGFARVGRPLIHGHCPMRTTGGRVASIRHLFCPWRADISR